MAKFELDLHNPKMYSYTKFELNVCNSSRDNERKPILWNDGMTKGNTICPRPFHGGGIKILERPAVNNQSINELYIIKSFFIHSFIFAFTCKRFSRLACRLLSGFGGRL
jgi:hypothetical protein